jgi:CheY-like chemotaxis protein
MPDEDGYALIHKVRALDPERGGTVPAIALTAKARAEDRSDALAAGFQMHMPKPVDPGEFTRMIAQTIAAKG